jgi:hypothetical protein
LRGYTHGDGLHVDLGHPVDHREDQRQSGRAEVRLDLAQPEHHTTLDLLNDLDRRDDDEEHEECEDSQENERRFSHVAHLSAGGFPLCPTVVLNEPGVSDVTHSRAEPVPTWTIASQG